VKIVLRITIRVNLLPRRSLVVGYAAREIGIRFHDGAVVGSDGTAPVCALPRVVRPSTAQYIVLAHACSPSPRDARSDPETRPTSWCPFPCRTGFNPEA
jgi:hypothetical protein